MKKIASVLLTSLLFVCRATALSEDIQSITPSVNKCGEPHCYWETNMDIANEDAVWKMLMQPITIVKGEQKATEYLFAHPSRDSNIVGELTCASQGVHVIETLDNGWSYIECYSSSFHTSKIKAWNEFVSGYIETQKLAKKEVMTDYGLVVDKLTQRLYIFEKGKLLDTLLVSTGLPNEDQPYNETRSGEYITVSPVGDFPSGNLTCRYGIRFNNGDLLHEVPYLDNADGTKNYSYCEKELGKRASHGCIRVQRLRTPNGINMRWIWETLRKKMGVKIVIWEDLQGRQIQIPHPNFLVYYNSDGGVNYHSKAFCYGVKDKYLPLTSIFYSELETEYKELSPCQYCTPVMRRDEIEKLNEKYSYEKEVENSHIHIVIK